MTFLCPSLLFPGQGAQITRRVGASPAAALDRSSFGQRRKIAAADTARAWSSSPPGPSHGAPGGAKASFCSASPGAKVEGEDSAPTCSGRIYFLAPAILIFAQRFPFVTKTFVRGKLNGGLAGNLSCLQKFHSPISLWLYFTWCLARRARFESEPCCFNREPNSLKAARTKCFGWGGVGWWGGFSCYVF